MVSEEFLGKPYILGALGEGPKARYDQFPAYRVECFDCVTMSPRAFPIFSPLT